jgi:peroxiredoxin
MEAVYQKLKGRGFEILAVNIMESPETAAAFMNENALTFPAALDAAGSVSARYGIQAIPTSFIIDKRGLIVSRVVGSIDWNTASIIAALESLF